MQKWTHRCYRILSSAYNQLTPPCSPGSHHQIHPPHRAWRGHWFILQTYENSGVDGYIACRDEVLKLEVLQLRYAHSLTVFISTSSDLDRLSTSWHHHIRHLPPTAAGPYERLGKERHPAVSVEDGQSFSWLLLQKPKVQIRSVKSAHTALAVKACLLGGNQLH